MGNKTIKVVVRFNSQQLQLLENLKKQGKFGEGYSDIIKNAFHEYIKYINTFPDYVEQRFGQGDT